VCFEILPEGKPTALLRPHTVDYALPLGGVKKNTGKPMFRKPFLKGKPVVDPVAVTLDAINGINLQHSGNLHSFLLIDPYIT
jgi:hypothetical protein